MDSCSFLCIIVQFLFIIHPKYFPLRQFMGSTKSFFLWNTTQKMRNRTNSKVTDSSIHTILLVVYVKQRTKIIGLCTIS